jgi:hypothetical protein
MTTKYRRSVADYVLISLRMALERAPLPELKSLALHQLHPCALLHLQPVMSFGSSPNSCKRWTQIQKLELQMDSTPFTLSRADEHLRIVQGYLRAFSATITKLNFSWTGLSKGPSPLSPEAEAPIPSPVLPYQATFAQSQPHLHSHPYFQPSKPLIFPCLRNLVLSRATAEAAQLGDFVTFHRSVLQDARFDDVSLRNGTWKSALVEPLKRIKHAELAEIAARQQLEDPYRPGTRVTVYDQDGDLAMDVPVCMLVDSGESASHEDDLIIEGELEPQFQRKKGIVDGLKRLFGLREKEWEPPVRWRDDQFQDSPWASRDRRRRGVFGSWRKW